MTDWSDVAAWLASEADRVIDTSCARVFLAGDQAWKIKKPVDFGFLDFSSLDKRRWALDRERALNGRLSGDIYRAVRKLTRTSGGFARDGGGEAVEWLLEMRRFDPAAVLGEHPTGVDPALAETIGRLIGRAHIEAEVATAPGLDAWLYTVDSNRAALAAACPPLDRDEVEAVLAATRAGREALTPLLEARRDAGFRRLCHGDLHLGNILVEDGRPIPFDCIEFSDVLGRMDIAYDAAFPVMDLAVRGQPGAAGGLLGAWLDEAARGFGAEVWDGLALLPQFLAVRASIRAHVTAQTPASGGDDGLARRYLAAAAGFLSPPRPSLTAIGGFSGVGKSLEAARRAARSAPGPLVLRSDLIRKRLLGAGPRQALPREAYAPAQDERTYAEMFAIARRALRAGWPVILDATFLDPARRALAESVAVEAAVPFDGVWLDAPAELLRARIAARAGDASDADLAVLERQLARDPGEITWARRGPS